MSLEERLAIGMPPDGVGKHFNIDYAIEFDYSNATRDFVVGELITGVSSNLSGTVARFIKETVTTGHVFLNLLPEDVGRDFTTNENIKDHDDVVIAQILGAPTTFYTQRAQIVGGNNPFNAQYVDRQGAAAVRFAEGSTQFDGFGRMIVSEPRSIGSYTSMYNLDPKMWYPQEIGTGNVDYIQDKVGYILSTGLADNDVARLTTQNYHPYQTGTGQLILLTAFCQDAGKAGVVRRWGYFDDEDGLYFQVDGDGLSAVIRSSTSGAVVETVINQADWNNDQMDGTGQSQFAIDVTKHNLYWIDFAWLGIGAVRFGAFSEDGSRIVAHTVKNANAHQAPYMRTPRLPIRYEIENTTAQGTSSEMFASCCAVKAEGELNFRHRPFGASIPQKTITGSGLQPICGTRATATRSGITSRIISLPKDLDVMAYLNGTSTPARVKISIIRTNAGLTGESWIGPTGDESLDLDITADGTPTGEVILSSVVVGTKTIDLSKHFDLFADERLSVRSDGTAVPYFVCAELIDPLQLVDIDLALNWTEV